MPQAARLILRQAALADIEEIDRYSAERFGAVIADTYARGLISALDAIAAFPQAAPLREDYGPGVRSKNYRRHRILYEVDEQGDVQIIRILHHARDVGEALGE